MGRGLELVPAGGGHPGQKHKFGEWGLQGGSPLSDWTVGTGHSVLELACTQVNTESEIGELASWHFV